MKTKDNSIFTLINKINTSTEVSKELLTNVEDLIKKDKDVVNALNDNKDTPLLVAVNAKNPNQDLVKLLLDKGANASAQTYTGCTSLFSAIKNDKPKIAKLIMKSEKFEINNEINKDFNNLLQKLNITSCYVIINSLKDQIKAFYSSQREVLTKAIKTNDIVMLQNEFNNPEIHKEIALWVVIEQNNVEMVEQLLQKYPNIDINFKYNDMLLLVKAIKNSNEKIVNLLIKAGANVNAEIVSGFKILHTAAEDCKSEFILQSLIDAGAKINSESHCGSTPILEACIHKNAVAVRVLMANGADILIENEYRKSCLRVAEQHTNAEIKKLLLSHFNKNPIDKNEKQLTKTTLDNNVESTIIDQSPSDPSSNDNSYTIKEEVPVEEMGTSLVEYSN